MIYSVSMMNSKYWLCDDIRESPVNDYKLSAMICEANNEEEARGMAQKWNESRYDPDDGWCLRKVIVLPVTLQELSGVVDSVVAEE